MLRLEEIQIRLKKKLIRFDILSSVPQIPKRPPLDTISLVRQLVLADVTVARETSVTSVLVESVINIAHRAIPPEGMCGSIITSLNLLLINFRGHGICHSQFIVS